MAQEINKKNRHSWIWDIPAKELPDRANDLWPSSCEHDETEVAVKANIKRKNTRPRTVAA